MSYTALEMEEHWQGSAVAIQIGYKVAIRGNSRCINLLKVNNEANSGAKGGGIGNMVAGSHWPCCWGSGDG